DRPGLEPYARLLAGPGGVTRGAFIFEDEALATVVTEPGDLSGLDLGLAWLEERQAVLKPGADLVLEVPGDNRALTHALEARGYSRDAEGFVRFTAPAGSLAAPEGVPGFTIRERRGRRDDLAFFDAAWEVFGFRDDPRAHAILAASSLAHPDLALVAVDEATGTVAAFATLWLDREDGLTEFEPVGTRPAHRRRGLARQLMLEAARRAGPLGATTLSVDGWSGSEAACGLYRGVGLKETRRIARYRHPVRPA
ncbi:MAG TPA: GNAT family N-acetyltransferase, partial [Deinococcales bacterium]|nr:GNAT family N-acetyltransferase [Deinococcales bacterium]